MPTVDTPATSEKQKKSQVAENSAAEKKPRGRPKKVSAEVTPDAISDAALTPRKRAAIKPPAEVDLLVETPKKKRSQSAGVKT